MKEVSTWIKQRFQGISEEGVTSDSIDFFEMRVRTAAFGGWVSDRPEEAISRFVESRRLKESGWPIVNQGHAFLGGMPRASERGAVEMILREGFQQMAAEDLETAYRLFSEGVEAWAFNPNHVMEALIQQTSGVERKEFLADLVKVSSWQEVLLREKDMQGLKEVKEEEGVQRIREIKGEEDFFDLTVWMPGFPYSSGLRASLRWHQDVLIRTRPEEARAILENERLDSGLQGEMVVALSLEHQRYYPLLSLLDDAEKPSAVRALMRKSQDSQYGPITGTESDRDFDPDVLGLALDQMEMSPETRAEILAELTSWGQERDAIARDCSHGEE